MWVRGLKHRNSANTAEVGKVAPHVGAWIETYYDKDGVLRPSVAPHVGAWIETYHTTA